LYLGIYQTIIHVINNLSKIISTGGEAGFMQSRPQKPPRHNGAEQASTSNFQPNHLSSTSDQTSTPAPPDLLKIKIPDSKGLPRKIAISPQKTNTEFKRKESHQDSPPEINHSIPNSTDPCPDTGDCKLPPNTRTSTGQC
jgi:hypothetical protein